MSTPVADDRQDAARTLGDDERIVVWRFLVGSGVGAIVGALVGGIGGRLAMFVLRLGSGVEVRGLKTDDGFEIGSFTTATSFLLIVTAGLGAVFGIAYVALRPALPPRGRPVIAGVVLALVMGADIVDPYSFDFSQLDSKPFSVVAFVALPGIAAAIVATLVERMQALEPWSSRPLTAILVLATLVLNVVLVVVAAVVALAIVLRRLPRLAGPLLAVAKIAVPLLLVAVSIRSGIDLYRETRALF